MKQQAIPTTDASQTIFSQASGNANPGRTTFLLRYNSADSYDIGPFLNDGTTTSFLKGTNRPDGVNFIQYLTEIEVGAVGDDFITRVDNGAIEDSVANLASYTTENSVCVVGGGQHSSFQDLGRININIAEAQVKSIVAIGRQLTTQENIDLLSWMGGLE